jgi:cold shock CspA family protein/ribosome-associated translation inhibitor RaiA
MDIALQVSFQGVPPSDAVRSACEDYVEKIGRHHALNRCRVVVAAPHQHGRHGNLYSVHIEADGPGLHAFANRDRHDEHAHEDVYVALRDAFAALEQQLEKADRQRRDHRGHRHPPAHADETTRGRVALVLPHLGYGFIETDDGREVYFHQEGLIGTAIDAIEVGVEVRFVEFEGDQGFQAREIRVVGGPVPELVP